MFFCIVDTAGIFARFRCFHYSFSYMSSQTPLFDAALDRFFAGIQSGERVCEESGEKFERTVRDLEQYRALRVPPSSLSFSAHIRHLRSFMAGFELFRRPASDGAPVISMFDAESPVPIMDRQKWYEETVNQNSLFAFGRPIDPAQSFFEQWKSFSFSVPRPAIAQDAKSEGCEWSVFALSSKNCYCAYAGASNEEMVYVDQSLECRHGSDLTVCVKCEWSYDDLHCQECSHTFFSQHCEGCLQVAFCLACVNCQDCFGCTNLKGKRWYFLNEPLTEEEYRRRLASIDLGDGAVVEAWKTKIRNEYWRNAPRRACHNPQSEDVYGDDHWNSRDVSGISIYEGERVHQCFASVKSKDSIGITSCLEAERCVNSAWIRHGYENRMSLMCNHSIDVEYSELLESCEHCFGCIGLVNKSYCIFNTQYTEAEYWLFVDKIKTAMLDRGEYGRYFPYDCSPFACNLSHASIVFPVTKEEADQRRARWYVFQDAEIQAESIAQLPLHIQDTKNEILQKIYRCPETGRVFRFVKPELELHRTLNIALPRVHPIARRIARMRDFFSPIIWQRVCDACGRSLETRIPPDFPSPILCEICFEKRMLES